MGVRSWVDMGNDFASMTGVACNPEQCRQECGRRLGSFEDVVEDNRIPFTVELVVGGEQRLQVGLTLSPDDDPNVLSVDVIWSPSLVSEWNNNQTTEARRVRVGDVIYMVNQVAAENHKG